MTKEVATTLDSGDIVIDTTINKTLVVSHNKARSGQSEFVECKYISPEYGWCNVNYKDLELV